MIDVPLHLKKTDDDYYTICLQNGKKYDLPTPRYLEVLSTIHPRNRD